MDDDFLDAIAEIEMYLAELRALPGDHSETTTEAENTIKALDAGNAYLMDAYDMISAIRQRIIEATAVVVNETAIC